jgi:hypothetical protein
MKHPDRVDSKGWVHGEVPRIYFSGYIAAGYSGDFGRNCYCATGDHSSLDAKV